MAIRFSGVTKARTVEIRFALSGKISNVSKHTCDDVKKWDLVASLDRKILQTELDQQLADYEKVRADWDGFTKKYPDPQDDNKFTKAEKQAGLNASVKQVELSKARLDQSDLFAPVDGLIIDDSGIVPGLYVTPASSPIKIIDTSSYYFEFEINQKDIPDFIDGKKCKVKIEGVREIKGGQATSAFSDGKRFIVKVPLTKTDGLLLGMKGEVTF